jgi:hypothetical protein
LACGFLVVVSYDSYVGMRGRGIAGCALCAPEPFVRWDKLLYRGPDLSRKQGGARRVYVCTIGPAGVNRKMRKRANYFLTISWRNTIQSGSG